MKRGILRLAAAVCLAAASPGASLAAPGDHVWSAGWDVNGVGSSVDGSGGVGIAGTFSGSVDFGGGTLTATSSDVFVAKLGADGSHVWSGRYDCTSFPTVTAIACAPGGDIYVAGLLTKGGTIDFGGGPIGLPDGRLWAVHFDAAGNHVWSDTFGNGTINDIDASDAEVVFAARNTISVDFGGGPLGTSGNVQAIVAKLAPDKSHVWSSAFGDGLTQEGLEVGLLGSGDVVFLASVSGTADFGGGGLTADADPDLALVRLDGSGGHVWSRLLTGSFTTYRTGMDVTSSGAICATGAFLGTADLGGGVLTSTGTDAWVGRFDSSGNHLWSTKLGSTGAEIGFGAWFDPDGRVIVSGTYSEPVDFGGGLLPHAGSNDAFLVSLDTSGAHVWSRGWGTTGFESRCEVEVGPGGDPVLSVSGPAGVDFGGGAVGGGFGVARVEGGAPGTSDLPEVDPVASTPRLRVAPNPFTQATTIHWDTPFATDGVALRIVDAAGRLVRSLAASDRDAFTWDGRDDTGERVAAGVYFLRVDSSGGRRTGRVIRVD